MRPIDADALADVYKKVEEKYKRDGNLMGVLLSKYKREMLEDHFLAPTLDNVIVLPCNIGDKIYEAHFMKDGTGSHICEYTCSGIHIADKVSRWRHEKPVRYLVIKTFGGRSIRARMDELGKTLFLKEDEAKAALQKGRKEKCG